MVGVLPDEANDEVREQFYTVRAHDPDEAMRIAFSLDEGTYDEVVQHIKGGMWTPADITSYTYLAMMYCRIVEERA